VNIEGFEIFFFIVYQKEQFVKKSALYSLKITFLMHWIFFFVAGSISGGSEEPEQAGEGGGRGGGGEQDEGGGGPHQVPCFKTLRRIPPP
jgi:hypothetical protein